jgi:phosphate transport system substrate-binding protein
MRRLNIVVLSVLVALSMLFSACTPAANQSAPTAAATTTPVVEEAPVVEEEPVEEPSNDMGMLPEVNPGDVTGNIVTAGSSTVYPLSEAMADLFRSEGYAGDITIDSIGSGAGLERFCKAGETDIANASRPIKDSEVESCRAIDREPIEFRVGTDALSVVVNPENDFITTLTLAELAMVFSDQAETWADVNPDWPAEPIKRYSPGTDSGTYDYFIEVVMTPAYEDDDDAARVAFQNAANLQQSEDDNVLVQGVQGDRYAIGYFGFAYFQENQESVKAISIEGVEPNEITAEDGSYPLARPLFIYSDASIMQEKPQVAAFINFYLTRVNEIILEVGYFPASEEAINNAMQSWLDAQ